MASSEPDSSLTGHTPSEAVLLQVLVELPRDFFLLSRASLLKLTESLAARVTACIIIHGWINRSRRTKTLTNHLLLALKDFRRFVPMSLESDLVNHECLRLSCAVLRSLWRADRHGSS